jgi:hypothetical protein
MPDVLQRAPILRRLAKASRVPGAHNSPILADIINRLKNPTGPQDDMLALAIEKGFYANAAAGEHFRKHWIDDPPGSGFWPGLPTKAIISQALLKVCELFRDTGFPIEFFWAISGDQGTDRFEVTVAECHGAKVLVVTFHTPAVPCNVATKAAPNLWVTREEFGAVVTRNILIPDVPVPVVVAKPVKKKLRRPKKK